MELHGHLPLGDDVLDTGVELDTEVVVLEVIYKVDVPDCLELLKFDLLFVVVQAGHVEHRVRVNALAGVDLEANSVATFVDEFLVPLPADLVVPIQLEVGAIVIILEPDVVAIVRGGQHDWRLCAKVVLLLDQVAFSGQAGPC